MDGVQLPQGYSHFEEAVYFLPFFTMQFTFYHFYQSDSVLTIFYQWIINDLLIQFLS